MGKEKKVVAGFWLRLLSDIIDALILAAFGFILAIPFKGIFYGLGEGGLFLGLIITFLYTGILQSHIGSGQSIAKKLFKIQVLNLDGSYLSLSKSFFRYSVIALIFYNSWIWMAVTSTVPILNNSILQSIFTFTIIFLFLGVTVLLVFHPLKRGIHDLIAGSIVVRKGLYDDNKISELNNRRKIKRAFLIWGSCCLLLVILSSYMLVQHKDSMPLLAELGDLQRTIAETTEFENISVKHTWHTFRDSDGIETKTTSIDIFPFLGKSKFDNETLKLGEIKKAVNYVVNSYSKLNECNYINVQVRTGFNIGIASFYFHETKSFNIQGELLTGIERSLR